MMKFLIIFTLVLICYCLAIQKPVFAQTAKSDNGIRRIALVIGNSFYENVETLVNPVNDSKAIREKLRKLDFEIFGGDDLDLVQFKEAAKQFKHEAETADQVVIYFSGHGFQQAGLNYLVPVDAKLATEQAIIEETLRLDTLITDVQSPDRQVLVFLDACRNDPLPPSKRTNRGLTQISTGSNVFVAFATQPGNISYDGRSNMSPFTRSIVTHIDREGQSISDLMIRVRNDVQKNTLFQQTPWDQSSLNSQFYFKPKKETVPLLANNDDAEATQLASLSSNKVLGADITTAQRSTGLAIGEAKKTLHDNTTQLNNTPPQQPITEQLEKSNIISVPEAPLAIFGKEDLIFAVQNQLKRLGCYRSDVDGIWGNGSRQSLQKYFKAKKQQVVSNEPTDVLYISLRSEKGIICKPPVIQVKRSKPFAPNVSKKAQPTTPREVATASPVTSEKPPVVTEVKPKKKSLAGAKLIGGLR